jgi:DNA-binding transcriptional MerR regulator
MDHVAEMESVLGDVFQPIVDEVKYKSISLSELVSASSLSESDIKALEAKGLIMPIETEHGLTYDDIDIRIAQIFKKLAEFGLKLHDFDIYHQYMETIRTEFKAIHDTIHQLPNHEIIPFQELFKIVGDLKRYLAMRVYREEAQHHHEHDLLQREDS